MSEYKFNKVFGPNITQEELFVNSNIPLLLDKAIEGFNIVIFAYGQTGGGKTYTMEGPINETKGETELIMNVFYIIYRMILVLYLVQSIISTIKSVLTLHERILYIVHSYRYIIIKFMTY